MLLGIILAQWQCPVASSETLDLLHQVICAILYQRTAMAIEMASEVGPFFVVILFAVAPVQRWEKVRVNFLTLSELALFSELKLNLT